MTDFVDLRWRSEDGSMLRLRPLTADDAACAIPVRLPPAAGGGDFAAALAAADAARRFGAIVVREEAGKEVPLACGWLLADGDGIGGSAAFALQVADHWRRQKLGRRLLLALIAEARRRQLGTMRAVVAADQRPMLDFLRHNGFALTPLFDGSICEARLTFDTTDGQAGAAVPAATGEGKVAGSQRQGPGSPATKESPRPGTAILCALFAMAGLLLAMTAVWLGTGWLDGFDYRYTNRLGRRFLRALPWALPLAALGGLLLYTYFRWALDETHKGWVGLIAVVRAFALFPFLGFAVLFAMMFGLAAAIGVGIWHKLARRPAAAEADGRFFPGLLIVPLWIMTLPFTLLKIQAQGDIEIPARIPRSRLLNWLPLLFLMLLVGPGFESEDSGERIDPNWLAALATYWLADCLIVTGYVAPALAARARAERIAGVRASH